MPGFRSRSQVRKFGALARRGEISKAEFRKRLDMTPSVKALPEKVKKGRAKRGGR